MTMVIEKQTEAVISFSDFIAFLDANVAKMDDLTRFDGLAEKMQELANNRTFFTEFLQQSFADLDSFQTSNPYGPQVFMMHRNEHYFVRVNYWPKNRGYSHPSDEVDRYFVYGRPHDHNFTFATVGYMGPGYETDLYTYQYVGVKGEPGEPVDLHFQGRETLSVGKVLIFETSKDIHVQLPPEAGSISINVIPNQRAVNTQYEFDIEKGCIADIEKQNNYRKNLKVLLEYFGDEHSRALYKTSFPETFA